MKIIIDGELTHLNDYIRAERGHYRKAAELKRDNTNLAAYGAMEHGAKPVPARLYPLCISFVWYTKDERVDADNVAFAKKFVLDGLVEAGILINDNRAHVAAFGGEQFIVDPDRPRVELTLEKFSPTH